MEKNTMKIVKVEPGKKAEIAEIANDLDAMQELVGGFIECIYWHDGPFVIICNEEGKLQGLRLNRALMTEDRQIADVIAGTFFIAGFEGDEFTGLSDEDAERFRAIYEKPEMFFRLGGDLCMQYMEA